jgi:hypothetical protein
MTVAISIPGGAGLFPGPTGSGPAPAPTITQQIVQDRPPLNAMINKAMLTFLVPPPMDRPFQSWRALIYTKQKPEKVFHSNRCLPSELTPDIEIMKRELCDPDHVPAFLVQLTEKDQFVYVEGDVCEVLSTEVHIADETTDKYLGKVPKSAPNLPKLILPGAGNYAPPSSTPITQDNGDVFVVDITFKTHGVKDKTLVDHVKEVAWTHGVVI